MFSVNHKLTYSNFVCISQKVLGFPACFSNVSCIVFHSIDNLVLFGSFQFIGQLFSFEMSFVKS